MSESEQFELSQQVAELTEQLSHVRAKRDQLDAQNLRVTDNLRKATEEREQAVKVAAAFQDQVASLQEQLQGMAALRAEYLAAKEAANTNSDNAAALREQLVEMTAERDTMERYRDQMRDLWDEARKASSEAQEQLRQMTAERDHATAQWQECCEDRSRQVTSLREQLAEMTASRDNFERLCKEWRIEFDAINAKKDDLQVQLSQWQVGHDVMKEQLTQAKEAADMFEAENTYLRDTIQKLRAKQIHDDLPGILCAIQLAVEQARELI